MESAASREKKELLRQQSIQRQIAQLQAQLLDPNAPLPSPVHASGLEETKRRKPDVTVLAPSSPQHKKRKLTPVVSPRRPEARVTDEHRNLCESNASDRGAVLPPQPGPSNVLSKLSSLSKRVPSPAEPDAPIRTSSFADKASGAPARDDRLVLIEDLEPGPYEHKPPLDDPFFGRFEPHSCIRLASRQLPYEDLQAYMSGRYYISPSKLYSVVRAQPGGAAGARGQAYDVPVVGDWVTIAVVSGRSPVRISRAPVAVGPGEARDVDDPDPTPTSSVTRNPKSAGRKDPEPPPVGGRKYVNMTLVDFGAGGGGGSNNNKKGTSRGDAVLSLLLFESDTYDTVSRGDGLLPEKIYKGGSRGAFETMAKLREGSVIALLNPRVLKPLQKPGAPNILALTPESAASVAIIGTARDLGMCGVVKRDGKPCGSWFDKRVSDVCEYHVQHAVQRCRAGRPEFSAGTSGMGVGSGSQKRKAAYDPQRKWGLQPANGSVGSPSSSQLEGGEGPTYVVAGHIVAGGAAGKHDMFLKEKLGRDAQARAARRTNSRDTDVALKRLLARDKEGMKAVQEAHKFAMKAKAREKQRVANGKDVGKEPKEGDTSDSDSSGNDDEEDDALADKPRSTTTKTTTKNAYSARVIKELGFDPTVKSLRGSHGRGREEGDEEPEGSRNEIYSKLRELASCRQPDRIRLGPRPGGRVRSVVSAPKEKFKLSAGPDSEGHGGMVDLDEISSGDEELNS